MNQVGPISALEEHARAFVVRMQGRWAPADVEILGGRLRHRRVDRVNDLDTVLAQAKAWFDSGTAHLSVCDGKACRERARDVERLMPRLRAFGDATGCQVSVTGCQGPCKQAPIATLRVSDRCEIFSQVFDLCDWEAVLEYAERAVRGGTLLCDPGPALPFRFDPVHTASHGSNALRRLGFLVGHFSGMGCYANRVGEFHKEVVGGWEAGGRFLALRMAVTYPLDDGRKDVHQALVIVGYDDGQGVYEARAFTDSGTTRTYSLAVGDDQILFEDRIPGHVAADRARKVLRPQAAGLDELLEVQTGSEAFRPYSMLELRPVRRAGRADAR